MFTCIHYYTQRDASSENMDVLEAIPDAEVEALIERGRAERTIRISSQP